MKEYKFNPATDITLTGYQLQEGMRVLAEDPALRIPRLNRGPRSEEFRTVTKLRRENEDTPRTIFIGDWDDGYRQTHNMRSSTAWIVKKTVKYAPEGNNVKDTRLTADEAHVMLDVLNYDENHPWDNYAGGKDDPKTTEQGWRQLRASAVKKMHNLVQDGTVTEPGTVDKEKEALRERVKLLEQALGEYMGDQEHETRRFRRELENIERVYRLRTEG